MKIDRVNTNNLAIKAPNDQNISEGSKSASSRRDKKKANHTIYAGSLNLNNDNIAAKKQQANKQALKTIMDQFKKAKVTDDHITSLNEKKDAYIKESLAAAGQIADLEVKKQNLKETFGISDDSIEQKNLDLLEKSIYHPEQITEDEYTQLRNMGSLTDYQKEALRFDGMQDTYRKIVNSAANGIIGVNQSVESIKLSMLKVHPMVDAQKEALKIIEDAINEVVGSLVQEAKENIDKNAEENKEKIKENQEEQEKEDAATGKVDDKSLTASEQIDQLQVVDELKKFAEKQNMLDDDIKGIEVDEQV